MFALLRLPLAVNRITLPIFESRNFDTRELSIQTSKKK